MTTPPPHSPAASVSIQPAPVPARPVPTGAWLLVLGVLLPLSTLAVEGTTHMCAEMLFDPLPTPVHAVLVAFVALSNLLALLQLRNPTPRRWAWTTFLNGVSIAVAAIYSVMFLPIMPIALVALLFIVGILPLSPLITLICALVARGRLYQQEAALGPPVALWKGLVVGVIITVAADAPVGLTRLAMARAMDGDPEVRAQSLRLLRFMGDDETMRAACYGGKGKASLLGLFSVAFGNVGPEQARRTYFQVTGRPFNRNFRPEVRGWDEDFDVDLAGDSVGGVVNGLSLAASKVQGSVDGDAALAYLEWTLRFEADATVRQGEARMQVQLPPGAVVSRVTLMVNGKEEEAAYSTTSRVKAAYQGVVHQRRDPVLVTWRGPDRVAVQAFPIDAQHPLTLKLGITAPLQPTNGLEEGLLRFPQLIDQNFAVADPMMDAVVLESRDPLGGVESLKALERSEGLHRVTGTLTTAQLSNALLHVKRDSSHTRAFTAFGSDDKTLVTQVISTRATPPPARVVLVVDGSRGLAPHRAELADALMQLPLDVETAAIAAQDDVVTILPPSPLTAELRKALASTVRGLDAVGGRDNVPALAAAAQLAAPKGETLVVWLHGPQPVQWDAIPTLEVLARPGLTLLDVPVRPASNAVLDRIGTVARVRGLNVRGKLREDLARTFQEWVVPHVVVERSTALRAGVDTTNAVETSSHLARLYVAQQVQLLAESGDHDHAATLAVQHKLITPVSGAVVLERKEQYDAAGLTQAEPGSVPTVPEPTTWAMIILALWMLHLARVRSVR